MEQRANIKFCVKLNKTFSETYNLVKQVYGDDCLSRTQVYDWFRRFKDGRESIEDDFKSGRPKTSTTDDNIRKVREKLAEDPNVTCRMLAEELGVSKDSVHMILRDHLKKRKVCSRFVPHSLTEDQKQARIHHSNDIIRTARRNPNFLKNIVTGDETWCYQYDPLTKRQSSVWKSPDEPTPKKLRFQKSRVKTMLICFYDSKGIVHKEFIPNGQNVTGQYYLCILERLWSRIVCVRLEYRAQGSWTLLHDNAPSHKCTAVRQFLAQRGIVVLDHPPYSSDLAPCDYFLFPKLKIPMKGTHYNDIPEIEAAVTAVLKAFPKQELQKSFEMLITRCERCIAAEGAYFE